MKLHVTLWMCWIYSTQGGESTRAFIEQKRSVGMKRLRMLLTTDYHIDFDRMARRDYEDDEEYQRRLDNEGSINRFLKDEYPDKHIAVGAHPYATDISVSMVLRPDENWEE